MGWAQVGEEQIKQSYRKGEKEFGYVCVFVVNLWLCFQFIAGLKSGVLLGSASAVIMPQLNN